MLELAERGWGELDEAERRVFDDWAHAATGADLYLLMRFGRRRWTRRRTSSSQTMQAIRDTKGDER